MDSNQIKKFQKEFSDWYPLDENSIRTASKDKGAYVIRAQQGKFGRLQGESDILYIGKTDAKNGFKERLSHYLRPGPTQWTSRRIHEMLKKYKMQVAWCPCSEPKNLEHRLLNQYLSEHDELPPFNHAGSKTLEKITSTTFTLADKVVVKHIRK